MHHDPYPTLIPVLATALAAAVRHGKSILEAEKKALLEKKKAGKTISEWETPPDAKTVVREAMAQVSATILRAPPAPSADPFKRPSDELMWRVGMTYDPTAHLTWKNGVWHFTNRGSTEVVSDEKAMSLAWGFFSELPQEEPSEAMFDRASAMTKAAREGHFHRRQLARDSRSKGGDPMAVFVAYADERPGDLTKIPNIHWLRNFFKDPAEPVVDNDCLVFSAKRTLKSPLGMVLNEGVRVYGDVFLITGRDVRTGFPTSLVTEKAQQDAMFVSASGRAMAKDVKDSEARRKQAELRAKKAPAAYTHLVSKVAGKPAEARSTVRGAGLALLRKVFGAVENAVFRNYMDLIVLSKHPSLLTDEDLPNLRHDIMGAAFGVYRGPVLVWRSGMERTRRDSFDANVYEPATQLVESDLAFFSEAEAKKVAAKLTKLDPGSEYQKVKGTAKND